MPAKLPGTGVYCAVVSGERDGTLWKCKLKCGATARVNLRGQRAPATALCPKCKGPECGATNNDGLTCGQPPKHKDVWHERDGRRWAYDARTKSTEATTSTPTPTDQQQREDVESNDG